MTRFKLIPWLAIPVLLLLGPVLPTATAATPASVEQADGLIYLPLDEVPTWLTQGAKTAGLSSSSAVGEVTVSQFGVADALVSNRNAFLCIRFDLPFDAAYTITKLSFPSRTQAANPPGPTSFASFRSVRVMGMDPTTGLPDKSQTYFHQRRYQGSPNGGMNEIALSIPATSPQTVFAVFDFPAPTAGIADTFPFLFTDRQFTDMGLFANSYATDTSAKVRTTPAPFLGTATGTALLVDQNIHASLTSQLSETAPLVSPTALGLNLRFDEGQDRAEYSYTNPANVLADGSPAPGGYLSGIELVVRDNTGWNFVASGGTGTGRIVLEGGVPGSGLQIWGVRSLDDAGNRSVVSNVTMTGASTVVGMAGSLGEDADEPNGRGTEQEATLLTTPVVNRAVSIWPAGDQDFYVVYARRGDVITATARPTGVDFRNDLQPVVQILDHRHDVVATAVAPSPGDAATAVYVASPPGADPRAHFIKVVDQSGSVIDPASWSRVLVPPTYNLSVDVQTPASLAQFGPSTAPVSSALDPDQFAFANAGANPVRGQATFAYVIPRSAAGGLPVRLSIFDVRGRLMQTVIEGNQSAGTHYATWSGLDARGNRVTSGAYFARLEAGGWSRTVRIAVVN
jgi:hypothetical protein